jgi:hypothetical protein
LAHRYRLGRNFTSGLHNVSAQALVHVAPFRGKRTPKGWHSLLAAGEFKHCVHGVRAQEIQHVENATVCGCSKFTESGRAWDLQKGLIQVTQNRGIIWLLGFGLGLKRITIDRS